MKILITYLFCFLYFSVTYAQSNKENIICAVDSINIERANKIAEKVLGTESKEFSYLIFSLDNKILFIHNTCVAYKLHTYNEEFNYETQKKEFKEIKSKELEKDEMLDRIFNTDICDKPFVYSKTDSLSKKYAHWDTKYIYFKIYTSGIKKCEFNLPMSYKVDVSGKKTLPIDQEIFNYLVGKLMADV